MLKIHLNFYRELVEMKQQQVDIIGIINSVRIKEIKFSDRGVLFSILFALKLGLADKEVITTPVFYASSLPSTIKIRLALLQTYLC